MKLFCSALFLHIYTYLNIINKNVESVIKFLCKLCRFCASYDIAIA